MSYIVSDLSLSKLDWRAEFKRLEGAYAPSTLKSYVSDVSIFVEWCVAAGRQALPASVETVCAFLEDQAQGRFPASVWRRVYAIRKVHRLLRLPDPTWDEDINITSAAFVECASTDRARRGA